MNLANYSAMLNTLTLLIDCDFRTAGVTTEFPNVDNRPTLADVLQGTATSGQAIEPIGDSGLHIMRAPEPRSVMHPMELLSSKQMQHLLRRLRRKFPTHYP